MGEVSHPFSKSHPLAKEKKERTVMNFPYLSLNDSSEIMRERSEDNGEELFTPHQIREKEREIIDVRDLEIRNCLHGVRYKD